MKKMVGRFGIVLVVAAMLVPFTSFAQSAQPIRVNIPFSFVVRDHLLRAGEYTLKLTSQGGKVWEIRGEGNALFVGASVGHDNGYTNSHRLRFECYTGECFLIEIHAFGDWAVPAGSRQRELAKNVRPDAREVVLR